MRVFLLLTLAITALPAFSSAKNIWEMQKHPTPGKAESIGTYSNGCIIGAVIVPLGGIRYFAHPAMKEYMRKLAAISKVKLMAGDIGLAKGGPFSSGHRSHQTGLDVDLYYPPADKRTELLKTATGFNEVDRIFVNPLIKKQLCTDHKGESWLGKIRPWYGHDKHFHVRLKCPSDGPDCKKPDDYDDIKGDGCDETLEWWFKERTKEELEELKQLEIERKKHLMELPERCKALVR